jgi:hypothetical protein
VAAGQVEYCRRPSLHGNKQNEFPYMLPRIQGRLSDISMHQLRLKKGCSNLLISVSLLSFKIGDSDEILTVTEMFGMVIATIELPKIASILRKKSLSELTLLEKWAAFMHYADSKEWRKCLLEIAFNEPDIMLAFDDLAYLSRPLPTREDSFLDIQAEFDSRHDAAIHRNFVEKCKRLLEDAKKKEEDLRQLNKDIEQFDELLKMKETLRQMNAAIARKDRQLGSAARALAAFGMDSAAIRAMLATSEGEILRLLEN